MHPWDLCPDQQPENCTEVNQQPQKRVQAYIVHVKKESVRIHETTRHLTQWRADMQMTLETLFLETSSTVDLLTVLSPIKRH